MSDHVNEKTVGKFTVKVYPDDSPWDPRNDDNMTKMICFHGRYSLGDKHDYRSEDYSGWDEMEAAIIKNEKPAVIRPLYLYDHSGITISTGPFSCPWDSGQIGFVLVTKENCRKEYGVKHVTEPIRQKAQSILDAEVKTYDQYLRGEVYYYEVLDEDEEVADSCDGWYDSDECLSEGVAIAESLSEKEPEVTGM